MDIFKIILALHILGGGTGLLVGSYVMLTKKGTKRHKLLGNVFFYGMLMASLVAMPMSYLHPNLFLFIVSVFTLYMLLTGKRYLKNKKTSDVNTVDWILAAFMLFFGLFFIFLGAKSLLNSNTFGYVPIVFGIISLLFVCQDWANFKGKGGIENYFLTTHIQRMVGGYIASSTAFLVVNNTILPDVVAWLLPTLLLTPLLIVWSKKYAISSKFINLKNPVSDRQT